jgi:hypothetical protein
MPSSRVIASEYFAGLQKSMDGVGVIMIALLLES